MQDLVRFLTPLVKVLIIINLHVFSKFIEFIAVMSLVMVEGYTAFMQ